MSQKNTLFTITVALFLIIACTTPSFLDLGPDPTPDPNAIHTTVAETAAKKMTQTAQALEMLLPPTETPVPTAARPTVGSILRAQPNGTTFFSDAVTGVELLVPEGWLALRIDGPEYSLALIDKKNEQLGLTQYLTTFRGQDANKLRLIAFDRTEAHKPELFPSALYLMTNYHSTAEELIKSTTDYKLDHENASLISEGTESLAPGVIAYTREFTYEGVTISTGDTIQIYEYYVAFEANEKVTAIYVIALDELRPIVNAQFEVVLASLNLFTP